MIDIQVSTPKGTATVQASTNLQEKGYVGRVRFTQGREHAIVRGQDGVVYCDCWQWKRKRNCKHLDAFWAALAKEVKITNVDQRDSLHQTIDQVVAELKGG